MHPLQGLYQRIGHAVTITKMRAMAGKCASHRGQGAMGV